MDLNVLPSINKVFLLYFFLKKTPFFNYTIKIRSQTKGLT